MTTNILLDTFPGLNLPQTVSFSLPSTTTPSDLLTHISTLLPPSLSASPRLVITTTSNKQVLHSDTTTLTDLTNSPCANPPTSAAAILPLRISTRLCGGKGGFGSQLRAAGGRMSSRKRKNQQPQNGSNRNLDGRRLRTITEAKSLATYLATKPDMDRAEKEERRKRWEDIVEQAERREEEIRSGKTGKGISDEWVAEKDEVGENVRDAVKKAMASQASHQVTDKTSSDSSDEKSATDDDSGSDAEAEAEPEMMVLDANDVARLKAEADEGDADAIWVLQNQIKNPKTASAAGPSRSKAPVKRFVGFDEDEEFSSTDDDDK